MAFLESDFGRAVSGSLDVLVSGMSSIFQQLTTIVQAELQIQTAGIEKKYEREISLAEGNNYKVRKLEKQKEMYKNVFFRPLSSFCVTHNAS